MIIRTFIFGPASRHSRGRSRGPLFSEPRADGGLMRCFNVGACPRLAIHRPVLGHAPALNLSPMGRTDHFGAFQSRALGSEPCCELLGGRMDASASSFQRHRSLDPSSRACPRFLSHLREAFSRSPHCDLVHRSTGEGHFVSGRAFRLLVCLAPSPLCERFQRVHSLRGL